MCDEVVNFGGTARGRLFRSAGDDDPDRYADSIGWGRGDSCTGRHGGVYANGGADRQRNTISYRLTFAR